MISGATIVYLSASDWDAPWHLPQEVAARFGRAGNRVIYVESLGRRRPRLFDLGRIAGRVRRAMGARLTTGRARAVAPGVELVSPLVLPGARSRPAALVNRFVLGQQLRRLLTPQDDPRVLVVFTPSRLANDLIGALGEVLSIYYCTQSHVHRPLAPPNTAELEAELLRRVDVVVSDAILLHRERAARHPFAYRVPGGVDTAGYKGARPAAWADGVRRPILGYLGTIDHRIDVALLAALAAERPDWTVAVVGPVVDVAVDSLARLPNVVMPGRVDFDRIPQSLAAFDVGLMPYADQPMSAYTYPAKLHQYLAAGLPIVSTPLPDLGEFAHIVETATAEGFRVAVERALERPTEVEVRRAIAAANSWERRMEALSAIVEGHLSGAPPAGFRDGIPS